MFHLCDLCHRDFKYKQNLIRHIREKHEKREYFSCVYENCRKEFIRIGYLKVHLIKVHRLEECKALMIIENCRGKRQICDARTEKKPRTEVYAPELEDISRKEDSTSLKDYMDDIEVLPVDEVENILNTDDVRYVNEEMQDKFSEDGVCYVKEKGVEEVDDKFGVDNVRYVNEEMEDKWWRWRSLCE